MRITERFIYTVKRLMFREEEIGQMLTRRWEFFIKPLIKLDNWWGHSMLYTLKDSLNAASVVKWNREHERDLVLKEVGNLIEDVKKKKLNS